MKKYSIHKYQSKDYSIWNDFISIAKNATFLFHRDFMEYHKDRFEDYSLMVYKGKKLVGVLPANRVGEIVYSHQGLSYGAIVVKKDIRIKDYLDIVYTLMFYLNTNKIESIIIKSLPKIYNTTLSDELDYVFFLMKGNLFRSDTYMVIDLQESYLPNRNRKRLFVKAKNKNVEVKLETNYEQFWNEILIVNLKTRFNISPVHSLEEITRLALNFPDQIKLYTASINEELKAGVVVFIMKNVLHFQYSSGSDTRNDTAELDALFNFIVHEYSEKKHISFGSSSTNAGININEGLAYWKESFGAVTSVQNFIELKTQNYIKLEKVMQ